MNTYNRGWNIRWSIYRGLVGNITLTFRLKYDDRVIHTQSCDITELKKNFGIGDEEKSKITKHFAHLLAESIPDSIILCVCGDKAVKKNKCRGCYLDSYTRTEEEGGACSICFENKGIWFKTHCGHIFHQQCLIRALKGKNQCPLCRAQIPHCIFAGGGQLNPYNV